MNTSPSKYPIQYFSSSKKVSINIEDLATPHLCNAWRKVEKEVVDAATLAATALVVESPGVPLLKAMTKELLSRGCTLDQETGQWTMPPKEEEATNE